MDQRWDMCRAFFLRTRGSTSPSTLFSPTQELENRWSTLRWQPSQGYPSCPPPSPSQGEKESCHPEDTKQNTNNTCQLEREKQHEGEHLPSTGQTKRSFIFYMQCVLMSQWREQAPRRKIEGRINGHFARNKLAKSNYSFQLTHTTNANQVLNQGNIFIKLAKFF